MSDEMKKAAREAREEAMAAKEQDDYSRIMRETEGMLLFPAAKWAADNAPAFTWAADQAGISHAQAMLFLRELKKPLWD